MQWIRACEEFLTDCHRAVVTHYKCWRLNKAIGNCRSIDDLPEELRNEIYRGTHHLEVIRDIHADYLFLLRFFELTSACPTTTKVRSTIFGKKVDPADLALHQRLLDPTTRRRTLLSLLISMNDLPPRKFNFFTADISRNNLLTTWLDNE